MTTLDTFIPLAQHLARRFARVTADRDDLAQEALWALTLAWQRTPQPKKPWSFARTVMARAMLGYYRPATESTALALDDVPELPDPATFDPEAQLDLMTFLAALESACGTEARWVVTNLLAPQGHFAAFVFAEVREKQRRRKVPGPKPRGIERTIRLSYRQLRQALGWSDARWDDQLRAIRQFTTAWQVRTCA